MIATIQGALIRHVGRTVVVDVAGLGFELQVPDSTGTRLPRTGESVELETHVEVQEDGIRLYGFATNTEKEAFRLLSSVSKVGAKVSLEVLSMMTVEQFREAVARGHVARLQAVSGIGKKLAERICFELKEKLGSLPVASQPPITTHPSGGGKLEDAVNGLVYDVRSDP